MRLQPGSVTVSGPSVAMFSGTLQSTWARVTSIAAVAILVALIVIESLDGAVGVGPQVCLVLANVSVPRFPPVSMPTPGSASPDGVGSPTPKPWETASNWPSGSPLPPVCEVLRSVSPDTQYAWLPTMPRLGLSRAPSTTYVTCAGLKSTWVVPRNAAAGANWSLTASSRWSGNSGEHAEALGAAGQGSYTSSS
ncbi:MAG: hypothetical protein ACXVUL_14830 [Solirubrobacteraceae bacterium]